MGTPLFYDRTYTTTGEQLPLLMNRWTRNDYSITVVAGDPGDTYTFEATLNRLNLDDGLVPVWFEIAGLTGISGDITDTIQRTPLEAIRINIASVVASIRVQIMQQGEC